MSWSGGGSQQGPFVTPPPAWGDDPISPRPRTPRRGRRDRPGDGRSSGATVLIVTLVAVALIAAGITGLVLGSRDRDNPTAFSAEDPAAALHAPPSERNRPADAHEPTTTVEGVPPDGAEFAPLDCVFAGTAVVEPAIGPSPAERVQMRLDDAANFGCDHAEGPAAGSVALDVDFEQLDLFSGYGRGAGRIDWDAVPDSRLPPGTPAPGPSVTDTEVEFILPQIIVWITVLDGPFEGFRGKLVLEDWELRQRPELGRTEVVFAPTGFGLGPTT
jgi:hypothetical protein